MDHRQSNRWSAGLYVLIYQQTQMRGIGTVKNFCLSGMYIESSCRDLETDQLVKLRCFLDGSNVFEDCWLTGMVVHKKERGFGFKIADADLQAQLALAWEAERLQARLSHFVADKTIRR